MLTPSPVLPHPAPPRYYGKYRGTVVSNTVPEGIGRILAQVPDVLGEMPSSWALPCLPFAGIQSGCFVVPPVGSWVWIEFERGNPDYPIWTGGFWNSAAEVPAGATTNGITLQTTGGASIRLDDSGICIENGKGAVITMIGPVVSINNGALNLD